MRWLARHYRLCTSTERAATKVLDIGCGAGAAARYLLAEGFSVCAVDGAPSAVQRLRAAVQQYGDRAGVIEADMTELPLLDANYDAAVDIVGMAHNGLEDCRAALAEVARVLKPGARLFAVWPSDRCARAAYAGKGAVTFLARGDVIAFYEPYFSIRLGWSAFADDGQTTYHHWLVDARRA